MSTADHTIDRDCVISGGGPAGMVLGYLLARAGLQVTVLEKHADFLRDFRGDTIHPSTISLLRDLGLRESFLELPLACVDTLDVVVDDTRFTLVDFSTLPERDNFLVFAPQWDFLNFVVDHGKDLPGFEVRMSTTAEDLVVEDGRVVGLRATDRDGDLEFRAPLTVAADGRHSILRDRAGMTPEESGVPVDVLWFHLPKPEVVARPTLGYMSSKGMVVTIDRGDYLQAGMVIPKGDFDRITADGLPAFHSMLGAAVPGLSEVVESIESWDQIKLLSVQLNRLATWHRPGFIAIGDAAHAMSPLFGVGINYAIQDAVALANAAAKDLAKGSVPDEVLADLQARREKPVKKMQLVQKLGHRVLSRAARSTGRRVLPRPVVWTAKAFSPRIRRFMAKFVGWGYLPEHPTFL